MDLKVKTIVAEILDIEVDNLNAEDDLLYLVYNDYVEFAGIICKIEDKFNIKISDEDCLNLKTVNNIVDYLKSVLKIS